MGLEFVFLVLHSEALLHGLWEWMMSFWRRIDTMHSDGKFDAIVLSMLVVLVAMKSKEHCSAANR